MVWLVISAMYYEGLENVDEFLDTGVTVRCVQYLHVLPPLCLNELLPVVHDVVGKVVMSGPCLYNLRCVLYVVVVCGVDLAGC